MEQRRSIKKMKQEQIKGREREKKKKRILWKNKFQLLVHINNGQLSKYTYFFLFF